MNVVVQFPYNEKEAEHQGRSLQSIELYEQSSHIINPRELKSPTRVKGQDYYKVQTKKRIFNEQMQRDSDYFDASCCSNIG